MNRVIVWLNGTFGCGKTTIAAELRSLIPSSRVSIRRR
jgi:adenylylsulfate kinase-like enzyme